MSNITIEKLQDAEAFLDRYTPKSIQEQYDHITCTIGKTIESLDDLSHYDNRAMIELINTTVNFKVISRALRELKYQLKTEKEEGSTN
jgi:phosphopantothenate synthetase